MKGARWTGEDIQRDEVLVDIDGMNFDSKRDRWNGYDPTEYQQVVEEFEKVRQTPSLQSFSLYVALQCLLLKSGN